MREPASQLHAELGADNCIVAFVHLRVAAHCNTNVASIFFETPSHGQVDLDTLSAMQQMCKLFASALFVELSKQAGYVQCCVLAASAVTDGRKSVVSPLLCSSTT